MNWKNHFSETLGIDYPIVQAPMLGITTPEMVAAISISGGLGSLPVGGLSPQKTTELIRRTKELTRKPFAVNLFVHDIPVPDERQVADMKAFLLDLCTRHNLPFHEQDFGTLQFYSYKEQVDILIAEKVPVVSFTFGIPDQDSVQRMKAAGIILIGTATCLDEALLLQDENIDMIAAQGIEAGGHRGSFIKDQPLPQVGLIALLSTIRDHIQKPVLAAGGIADTIGIQSVMNMGAAAVQIGTLFIASDESAAIPAYKEAVLQAKDTDTVLTRAFSGRWARGIYNRFMEELDAAADIIIPEYPVQNSLTAKIRSLAQQQNNKELTNLWAGQSAYKARAKPSAEIFMDLVKEGV